MRRPIIRLMTPRGFLRVGVIDSQWTGGEIFSNVNAGTVYPLAATELKYPWHFLGAFHPTQEWNCLNLSLWQMRGNYINIADSSLRF